MKTSSSDKETSRKKILKFPCRIPQENKKYKRNTICKYFIEADSRIQERIRKSRPLGTINQMSPSSICRYKSRAMGTNNQMSSSIICRYNLLRKADTLLEILYRPGKTGRLLQVKELRCGKFILQRKKVDVYRKFLKLALKKYAKTDIKVSRSYLTLPDFLIFFKMLCIRLKLL